MKLATVLVSLLSAVPLAAQTAAAPTVVFVCEHGAAKSVTRDAIRRHVEQLLDDLARKRE